MVCGMRRPPEFLLLANPEFLEIPQGAISESPPAAPRLPRACNFSLEPLKIPVRHHRRCGLLSLQIICHLQMSPYDGQRLLDERNQLVAADRRLRRGQ